MTLRLISIFFLAFTLLACSKPPYTNLDNKQLKTMLEDKSAPLFDIRRAEEWKETGVVEGSQLLTFVDGAGRVKPQFFEQLTKQVGKNDPIILICRTGNRTNVLARHLMETMGYTKVYNVRHGITDWIGDDLPVKRN